MIINATHSYHISKTLIKGGERKEETHPTDKFFNNTYLIDWKREGRREKVFQLDFETKRPFPTVIALKPFYLSPFHSCPASFPLLFLLPAAPNLALQHKMFFLHLGLGHVNCSEWQDPQALMKLLPKLMRLGTRSSYSEWFARAAPHSLLETTQKSLLHQQFSASALISSQVRNIFCFIPDLTVINTTVSMHHLILYDLERAERAKITVSL